MDDTATVSHDGGARGDAARDTTPRTEPRTLIGRVAELLRLALPVTVSRSGQLVMALVNTILVGHYAAQELAYLSIAHAVTMPLFVGSSGFVLGSLVETARAYGAGRTADCGAVWRRGAVYAFGVGLICMVLAMAGEAVLSLAGQSENISSEGGKVVRVLALGLPFMIVYMSSAFFLEGLKRPTAPMVLMLIANVLNVGLNWVLIYGHFGFPEMGALGSAWASTILRAALAVAIVAYIWNLRDRAALAIRRKASGGWASWAHQRKVGYSAGTSQFVEASTFSLLTLIAGLIGVTAVAAYSIAFQLLGLVFMIALGIGSATAVLVGHAWGRKDARAMARAGWLGLGVDAVIVSSVGGCIVLLSEYITPAFTDDPALIALATPLVAYMGFIVVLDTFQAVMALALRGRGDNWVPVLTHTISYIVVQTPCAIYFALYTARGVTGILDAILIASAVSASFLIARFYWLSRDGKVAA